MATQQEVIRQLVGSLDKSTDTNGVSALDTAIRSCSAYQSTQQLVDDFVSKCDSMRGKDEAQVKSFLKYTCGIDLDNDDTGSITGSDAGGTLKTKETVVPENRNGVEPRYPTASGAVYSLARSGHGTNLKATFPVSSPPGDSEKSFLTGLYTWWLTGAEKLVYDSYGLYFNKLSDDTDRKFDHIDIQFMNENSNTRALTSFKNDHMSMTFNVKYLADANHKFYWGNGKDASGYSSLDRLYTDRLVAHEMTHALFFSNVDWRINNTLPEFFSEGIAELVHGADDDRGSHIIRLVSGDMDLRSALSMNSGTLHTESYAAGYMLLRYLAKRAASGGGMELGASPSPTSNIPTDYSLTSLKPTTPGRYWLTGYDLLTGTQDVAYPLAKVLDGSDVSGDLILAGNGQDNVITGGKGSSSLWGGGASRDQLQGGSGRDMFWYGVGDGQDTITSFATGADANSDVLDFYNGGLAGVRRSGSSLRMDMADGGSLTVATNGGADSLVLYSTDAVNLHGAKIGESSGTNRLTYTEAADYYQGSGGVDTVVASGSADKRIWLDGSQGKAYNSIEVIDGSASSGADQLAGSGASEVIIGGSGSASLWGGGGSAYDHIRAGSGANSIFYGYGEGDDIVENTTASDRVMLYNIGLGNVAAASIGNSDVHITTTAGQTLTVYGEARYTLADGSTWKADHKTKQWSAV